MLHVGVFILLVLSGERNFSVRLNKPYSSKVPMDIPRLSKGTHADLLFLVRKLASDTTVQSLIIKVHNYIAALSDSSKTVLILYLHVQ